MLHLSGNLFSQEPATFYLFGRITSADTITLPNVHVVNISEGIGAITDRQGRFAIPAGDSDTVRISYIGFHPLLLILPGSVLSDVYKNFKLSPDTILLSETIIYPFPSNPEQLKRELLTLELLDTVTQFDLRLDQVPIAPDTETGMIIRGPFTVLYDHFNRSGKLKRYHENKMGREEISENVEMIYNGALIKKITRLTDEEKIEEFVNFCNLQPQFILHVGRYELYLAIFECFKDFNNLTE